MGKEYHEFGVIHNTLKSIPEFRNKNYIGYNILAHNRLPSYINRENTLYVVSADFSHFLSLQEAIHLENCATTNHSSTQYS